MFGFWQHAPLLLVCCVGSPLKQPLCTVIIWHDWKKEGESSGTISQLLMKMSHIAMSVRRPVCYCGKNNTQHKTKRKRNWRCNQKEGRRRRRRSLPRWEAHWRNIQVYNVKIYMVKTDLALMSVAFSNCNWSSSNVTFESWSHNKIILSAYRKLLYKLIILLKNKQKTQHTLKINKNGWIKQPCEKYNIYI